MTEYKGSYTVEAAAVMPLTFLVLGALLLCAFFVHDRAVVQSMVCEAAAAGGNFATEKERSEAVAAAVHAVSEQRFLGSRGVELYTDMGQNQVKAGGSAAFPVPGMFASFLSGGVLSISCEWENRVVDPAEVIRKIRGAELVIENLTQ